MLISSFPLTSICVHLRFIFLNTAQLAFQGLRGIGITRDTEQGVGEVRAAAFGGDEDVAAVFLQIPCGGLTGGLPAFCDKCLEAMVTKFCLISGYSEFVDRLRFREVGFCERRHDSSASSPAACGGLEDVEQAKQEFRAWRAKSGIDRAKR